MPSSKGYAEVVYQFGNGNGFIALYRPVSGSLNRLEYRATFRKAGEYDPTRYDKVFTHTDLKSVSTSQYGGRPEKSVVAQRMRNASGPARLGAPGSFPL